MNSNQNNATYEHDQKLKGLSVVESWIIEDPKHDKSVKYGFSLPVGTWMISMKVNNEDVWKKVKDGSVKGFSIEGYFADKLEMSLNNIDEMEEKLMIDKIKELITKSELGSQNVNLSLADDIEKLLDGVNAKRRQLSTQGLKISEQFLALTVEYNKILSMSIDAANKAKDLGIADAEKYFRVRGAEAKDYSSVVGKVSNVIADSIRSI
jgi:hypothetical protein